MTKTTRIFDIFFILFFAVTTGYAQSPATNFNFALGAGKTAPGYTRVMATDLYDTIKGHGFDFGTMPVSRLQVTRWVLVLQHPAHLINGNLLPVRKVPLLNPMEIDKS